MVSRIWPVNLLLFVAILILSIKAYDAWFTDKFNPGRELINETLQKSEGNAGVKAKGIQSAEFYNAIVEKNLFFSDRTGKDDTVSQPVSKVSEQKLLEQDIVLYGVMIVEDEKKALITNPYAEQGAAKTIWVKVGERVNDDPNKPEIKVNSILKEKIVISIDGKEFDRHLRQKKDTPDQPGLPEVNTPESNKPKRPAIEDNPIPHEDPTGKTPAPPFEISPDGKYKIFETPFGKIKRRIN